MSLSESALTSFSSFSEQSVTEVLSLLRHELRTPINGILGYAEIILDDLEDNESEQCNPAIVTALHSIQSSAQRILLVINKYLVLSSELEQDFEQHLKKIIELLTQETLPALAQICTDCSQLEQETFLKESLADIDKIEYSTNNLKQIVQLIAGVEFNSSDDLIELIGKKEKDSQSSPLDQPENDSITPVIGEKLGFILIVDDVENNRVLFSRQLQRQGYEIDTASNGYDALEKVSQTDYDLILLDFMMPELNGFEVLSRLKSDDKLRHVPVIMISANDEIEQVIRCIEIGAEDYLPKPLNSTLLRARITSTLEKKQFRDREREYLRQVELLSEKMTKELEMGRQMQLNFLPRQLVEHPDWEFSAFFRPARQVAGDFYDIFELTESRIGIVIADVCDKGVGAALFMALFRSLIRIFSYQTQLRYGTIFPNPKSAIEEQTMEAFIRPDLLKSEQILEAVQLTNDYVATHHGDLSMFATLFFGILDLKNSQLTYINGGHEPLVVIAANGQIKQKLKSTGPAVGMIPEIRFEIAQATIETGETLVGYTDGVPEARNSAGQFFSKDTLFELLNHPFDSGVALLEEIKTRVLTHIDAAEQFDDITLIAVHHRQSEFKINKPFPVN